MSDSFQNPSPGTGRPGSASRISVSHLFIGREGIRSGWSALLFVGLYLILSTVAGGVLQRWFPPQSATAPLRVGVVLVQELAEFIALLVSVIVMAGMEKRNLLSFGYRDARMASHLAWGLLWGLFSLSFLIGIFSKTKLLIIDGFSLIGFAAWKYALAWAGASFIVGIFEESLLRGYLQSTLARGIGFWGAAVALSIAFALWHISNGGESFVGLFVVGLGGLVFCLSLWYTKSLWWAIGFHAGWDWGQSFLFGTPDSGLQVEGHLLASHPAGNPLWSGGSTGPEGSVLMVPLLCAMAAAMHLWWRRKQGGQI